MERFVGAVHSSERNAACGKKIILMKFISGDNFLGFFVSCNLFLVEQIFRIIVRKKGHQHLPAQRQHPFIHPNHRPMFL